MANNNKVNEYSLKILGALNEIFDENSEHYIDDKFDGNNLTHLIHALANVAPNVVYRQLTGEEINNLDFNHIANKLCFQYSEKIGDEI